MSSISQILALIKQELRIAMRARYVILAFVLMPVAMWVMQGGYLLLMTNLVDDVTTQEGETIFVANYDISNSTLNDLVPGIGDNLGDYFVSQLITQAELPSNMSLLSGATIDNTTYSSTEYSYEQLMELLKDPKKVNDVTPLIIIHSNFTNSYLAYSNPSNTIPPAIEIRSLPSGIIGSESLSSAIWSVISQPPFQVVDVHKYVRLSSTTIVFEGEESASSNFGTGFMGMLSLMVAVLAPAAFVSTSFAGEREKKTMESLLALPIPRLHIMFSKLAAGMVLICIFALMNTVGLLGFSVVVDALAPDGEVESVISMFRFEITPVLLILVAVTMFLAAFVSIGIGIAIASLAKDVRSASSTYNFVMMLPSMIVGLAGMFGGLPENAFGGAGVFLYILPWAHVLAILSKGLYPLTYASSALTGDITLDLVFHLGYIVVVIVIFIIIASKIFDREGILT
ncbi:MAG: ABC transporter permease subunit [Candidatus Odinarchaeota archaeon]